MKSSVPPYFLGMLAGSMNLESVGKAVWSESMKILLTVIGSNQRFIQLQTWGKKEGAPTIYFTSSISKAYMGTETEVLWNLTKMRSRVSG